MDEATLFEPSRRPAPKAGYHAWLGAVAAAPHGYDFYQVLRHIETSNPQLPRLGEALRPADEPLRLTQPAELTFAATPLHSVQYTASGTPRLRQRIFGLLGPNGPLPIHISELARDRENQHADHALQRFLDSLTHRFALLFYRAWAQAQPALGLDRPGDNPYARRIGSLFGIGADPGLGRDAVGDHAKLFFAGRLARQVRDADGLLAWCRSEFDVPVAIEQWCGHWMTLAKDERSRLGRRGGAQLGRTTVLGGSVWDVQHKFRIAIGPLRLEQYRRFLPGGADLARLQALVRSWVGIEFEWDVKLILLRDEVPRVRLGSRHTALGQASWLGRRRRAGNADDLCIDVERARAARVAPGTLPAAADFSAWPLQGAPGPA